MNNEINAYIDYLIADYRKWTERGREFHGHDEAWVDKRVREYADSVEVRPGRKYVKIVSDRSVHSFIVATDDDKKFKKGDILKPAGFATPTRNSARGNILEGEYGNCSWAGPGYLK
jgi:uncharacterized Ntn-hydrolase superfamily protein